MKKAAQLLTVGLFAGVWAAFFLPVAASAQSAPSLIMAQSHVEATSTASCNSNYICYGIFLGSGYSGTITSIDIVVSSITTFGSPSSYGNDFFGEVDQATSSTDAITGSYPTCVVQAAANQVNNFLQLNVVSQTANGCTLDPNKFVYFRFNAQQAHFNNHYVIDYVFGSTVHSAGFNYSVQSSSYFNCAVDNMCETTFFPSFDILGGSWSLIPTTTASGLSLSGAQAYCNGVFASSTGIGYDIMNGFCVAVGFLFIPSSDSVQSFTSIPSLLGQTFPFSWAVQAQSALKGATASSSDNFISLSATVGTSSSSFEIINAPLISTSTLSSYPGWDTVRNTFKGILTASFYLLALYAIYRTIIRIWYTA